MQGTHLREANFDIIKQALAEDYKQHDSWVLQGVEQMSLLNYFQTMLKSYKLINSETLFEMCKYLNAHIVGQQPPLNYGGDGLTA